MLLQAPIDPRATGLHTAAQRFSLRPTRVEQFRVQMEIVGLQFAQPQNLLAARLDDDCQRLDQAIDRATLRRDSRDEIIARESIQLRCQTTATQFFNVVRATVEEFVDDDHIGEHHGGDFIQLTAAEWIGDLFAVTQR